MRPVVCFFPARNEAATVGDVVRRLPHSVADHPVRTLVVDDGSVDDTALVARRAGATVVPGEARGLGAAIRTGLVAALELDAVAVAFADADGEYAPEELDAILAPIFAGTADYVVGSRFAGHIERMMPHRMFGNRVLTEVVARLARTPISDAQSGYRGLSIAAARDATIIHDYNYAQVLTLDLLAKGYRYAEVPITYSFREHGKSFVRLLPYLAHVAPAVRRQLLINRARSVLDDVRQEPLASMSPLAPIERAT
jgi:glycosyltransferase involved in cell wall biosynthesis